MHAQVVQAYADATDEVRLMQTCTTARNATMHSQHRPCAELVSSTYNSQLWAAWRRTVALALTAKWLHIPLAAAAAAAVALTG